MMDLLVDVDTSEWERFYTPAGFIYFCEEMCEEATFVEEADLAAQQVLLKTLKEARKKCDDDEARYVAAVLRSKVKRRVMSIALMERGNRFVYPADPIRTADGKKVSMHPPVIVNLVPGCESVVKSPGHLFNDVNVKVWMTTLMRCCYRRGYGRISDVMREYVMKYVQCGSISIIDVYDKEPNLVRSGMRLKLLAKTIIAKQPKESSFYTHIPVQDYVLPEDAKNGTQLACAIVSGVEDGRITKATDMNKLAYYEHSLSNYIEKHGKASHNYIEMLQVAHKLTSWTIGKRSF